MQRPRFDFRTQSVQKHFTPNGDSRTHKGRINGDQVFRARCDCSFRGPDQRYRYDAVRDLLDHYEKAGTLEHPLVIEFDPTDVCNMEMRAYI